MEKLPLVSIVTPSYNQVDYLKDTLLSVIRQGYPKIEYLIIDGGSTDGSAELIEDFSRKYSERIKWHVSEKDQGQAHAINKGLLHATGDIIAWLNSDDLYLLQNTIEKVVNVFNANPQLNLIYSNVVSINSDDQIINIMRYGNWSLGDLMAFNIIGQPGVFFRRDVLENVGYLDESFHYLLDHQYWLRIGIRSRIGFQDECLAAARFHEKAKNISQSTHFSEEAFRILDWIITSPDYQENYKKNKRKIHAGAYRFSARYLLDAQDNQQAIKHYWTSMKYHPPTAFKEIHRILFAILNLFLPLDGLKKSYLKLKQNRLMQNQSGKVDKWWLND